MDLFVGTMENPITITDCNILLLEYFNSRGKSVSDFLFIDADPDIFIEAIEEIKAALCDCDPEPKESEQCFNCSDKVRYHCEMIMECTQIDNINSTKVRINSYGKIFHTCIKTLEKCDYFNNFFHKFSSPDLSKDIILDVNPHAFACLLSYLRNPYCLIPHKFKRQLHFFCLPSDNFELDYSIVVSKKNNPIVGSKHEPTPSSSTMTPSVISTNPSITYLRILGRIPTNNFCNLIKMTIDEPSTSTLLSFSFTTVKQFPKHLYGISAMFKNTKAMMLFLISLKRIRIYIGDTLIEQHTNISLYNLNHIKNASDMHTANMLSLSPLILSAIYLFDNEKVKVEIEVETKTTEKSKTHSLDFSVVTNVIEMFDQSEVYRFRDVAYQQLVNRNFEIVTDDYQCNHEMSLPDLCAKYLILTVIPKNCKAPFEKFETPDVWCGQLINKNIVIDINSVTCQQYQKKYYDMPNSSVYLVSPQLDYILNNPNYYGSYDLSNAKLYFNTTVPVKLHISIIYVNILAVSSPNSTRIYSGFRAT